MQAAVDVSEAAFPDEMDAAVPENYAWNAPGGSSDPQDSAAPKAHELDLTEWVPSGSRDPPEAYLSHFDVTGVHDGYGLRALSAEIAMP